MCAVSVGFVTSGDGALNCRRGEGDAVAFCSKVGCRDAEFDAVQPVILVFAVSAFGAESHRNRGAGIFTAGDQYLVGIDCGTGQIGGNIGSDIVNAE